MKKDSGRWISISPGATCTESSSHLWEHCWYCSARQRMPTPGREGLLWQYSGWLTCGTSYAEYIIFGDFYRERCIIDVN